LRERPVIAAEERKKGGKMFVYRLEPIILDHPSWQKSSHKERVWVEAIYERDARQRVTDATYKGTLAARSSPNLHSPWDLADVTRCVAEDRRKPLKKKGVITQSGDWLACEADIDPGE
jgi:hypothetical protein